MKKVLILGSNGYLGNALFTSLSEKGYEVMGIDNDSRKDNVLSVGSESLTPIKNNPYYGLDICNYEELKDVINKFYPDTIIHLAEQPSAPFSMKSPIHAANTQQNNVIGTLNVLWAIKEVNPKIHLIKLGTEGEYPADLWDGKHIPEGANITVQYKGEDWKIPVPRGAGSFYHWSKVFDDLNIEYACKIWGLRATNIQQGVVFGHIEGTRFDTDYYFGTVINRFVAQAIAGLPLTIYGTGGQTRGFINIRNSIQAMNLFIDNPPEEGEFKVIHQTTREYSVKGIAEMIQKFTECEISYIKNPRIEKVANHFTFDTSTLDKLGLQEISLLQEMPRLIETVSKYKKNINKKVIMSTTNWR